MSAKSRCGRGTGGREESADIIKWNNRICVGG